MTTIEKLSRRERQIMDILHRLQEASAKDVLVDLPDAPGYSSVRTHLKKLVDKGLVGHKEVGLKYIYFPLQKQKAASHSALANVVRTFFGDSPALAINQLLDITNEDISRKELEELERLVQEKLNQKNSN